MGGSDQRREDLVEGSHEYHADYQKDPETMDRIICPNKNVGTTEYQIAVARPHFNTQSRELEHSRE